MPASVCTRSQTRLGNSPRRSVSSRLIFIYHFRPSRRRSPMKKALSLTAFAAAAVVAFGAQAQTKQYKFQSTWPASLTLQDNFKFFAERVDKLTRGEVKIEALAAGQIVPAF